MKKRLLAAMIASAALGVGTAQAGDITFDMDGGTLAGNEIQVDTFDYAPSNVLFQGMVPSPGSPSFGAFNLWGAGLVSNFFLGNVAQSGGFLATNEFTFEFFVPSEATFTSVLDGANFPDTDPLYIYRVADPGSLGYFKVWHGTGGTKDSNDITGTGYNNGTLILTALATSGGGTVTVDDDALVALDTAAPIVDGRSSYRMSGGIRLNLEVISFDSNYFLDNIDVAAPLVVDLEIPSSSGLQSPFTTVNPSDAVVGQVPVFGAGNTIDGSDIGCLPTGIGAPCDLLAQSDMSMTFTAEGVPEPTTLALLGMGLAAAGGAARRRRSQAVKG
jgi:hypothetical protein